MTSVGGPPSPHPMVSRKNAAAIDRFDGHATSWAPNPDGVVNTLHSTVRDDELDTVLAGGAFANIGNPPASRRHAAEINLADDGSVTGWDPSPGTTGTPRAFVSFACDISIGTLAEPSCATLAGGTFDSVRQGPTTFATRNRLAQVTRHTGFAHDWAPDLDGAALAFACVPPAALSGQRCDNSLTRVFAVGGLFTEVSGMPRGRLAFFARP